MAMYSFSTYETVVTKPRLGGTAQDTRTPASRHCEPQRSNLGQRRGAWGGRRVMAEGGVLVRVGGHPQWALRAGESRGAQPLWQGSGGVPQRALISSPAKQSGAAAGRLGRPARDGGGRGTSTCGGTSTMGITCGGVQRGTASLAGVWGCPPESFNFFPSEAIWGSGGAPGEAGA